MKPTEKDIINDYHGGPMALMILITMFLAIIAFFVIGLLALFLKTKWCVLALLIILLFLLIFVAGRLMAELYVKHKK